MKYFRGRVGRLILLSIIGVATIGGCQKQAGTLRQANRARSTAELELLEHFSSKGKPIHPRAIDELLPWLSCGPTIMAVDPLAANENSNRYRFQEVTQDKSWVRWNNPDDGGKTWTEYRHIGTLGDGTIVLETAQGGGGTGVFEDLLFLSVDTRQVVQLKNNEISPGLIMTVVGMYPLGDRDQREITIDHDRVLVGGEVVTR